MPIRTMLAVLAAAGTAASAQSCPWVLETTPNPEGSLILYAIDGLDSGIVWTAGDRRVYDIGDSQSYNYIARWDGSSWSQTPAPQPSTLRDWQSLHGVLAVAESDAITVGVYNPDSGPSQAQSVRWDGSGWSLMDSPDFPAGSGFFGIGRMGDDIWAVGHKDSELLPPAALTFPMAARLDGDDWEVVFVPALAELFGRTYNILRAVEGAAADDGWAAGIAQQFGTDPFGPVAMLVRWDGEDWTQYDLFDVVASTFFSALTDLAVLGPDDAWASGYDYDHARQQTIPLILRWDGTAWTNFPVPTFEHSAELRAIAALAPDRVFAAGTQTDANGFPHALMLEFDGAAWTVVPPSELADYGTWFRGLSVAGGEVWASGQSNDLDAGLTQRREACGGGCTADRTGDGVLDFFDVADFLDAFAASDPSADLTGDGAFDFFDVAAYLDAFSAGCG